MAMRSRSPRVLSVCAARVPSRFERRALWRAFACVAAVFGLLAIDAPLNSAFAFFFDDFGGGGYDFSYGNYYSGEHAARRRHNHKAHSGRLSLSHRRHRGGDWTVASDPQTASPILHRAGYSPALAGGFSTPLFPRTVCVRACDGYAFGRAAAFGGYDAGSRETACAASCPDAETKLFVLPAGVDDVAQAKEARVGESYAQLLAQFRNRENKPASCGCHVDSTPNGEAKALLSDPTLRQGDMVVTDKGVKVFLGGGALPHKTSEFLSLAQTSAVSPAHRGAAAAIDKMLKLRPADPAPNPNAPQPPATAH
ncbi:MAG: DUF2865 domain-containing protein [Methylocystis sp.]